MKLKVGDRVYIKPTGQIGVIIRIVDNPWLPDWMSKDWYHIQTDCNRKKLERLSLLYARLPMKKDTTKNTIHSMI